jgi:GNAT superfamily N-acetyltransferase
MSTATGEIRRELRAEDLDGIVELHRRVYVPEYGMGEAFLGGVRAAIEDAQSFGWPASGGGVWLIDHHGRLGGSIALIDEGAGLGRVRWFVLEPGLRGRGLGRRLVAELVQAAREAGMVRLLLETFGALRVAGHLYREAGFELCWERPRADWGAPIVYQHYELDLGGAGVWPSAGGEAGVRQRGGRT